MSATAVVFPGQGTQRAGMGKDFVEAFDGSRRIFEHASDALSLDLAELCFEENNRLDLTEFAQPAIITIEIAMFCALTEEFGFQADVFGGHSLGEYAGLVAAGVIEIGEAVRLVRERGRLMQEAVPVGQGAMTAMISADVDRDAVSQRLEQLAHGEVVEVANHNAANQIVLSGSKGGVDLAVEALRGEAAFAKSKFIPLKVSAPFHSSLMRPAEEAFRPLLTESATRWNGSAGPRVVSNVSGTFHGDDAVAIAESLAAQMTAPVRWVDNMKALADTAETIVEVGPGKPLSAFFKSIGRKTDFVTQAADAEKFVSPDAG